MKPKTKPHKIAVEHRFNDGRTFRVYAPVAWSKRHGEVAIFSPGMPEYGETWVAYSIEGSAKIRKRAKKPETLRAIDAAISDLERVRVKLTRTKF